MYTNKHLDSFPASIHCKYESAKPKKHIEQSSENSAWDLFDIWLARNIAQGLITDPNNKTTVWEGVLWVSGASHTSQASSLSPPSLVGHVIFYTWNGTQSTKSWTSCLFHPPLHLKLQIPTSSTPSSSCTSHHSIGSFSFGAILLYKVARESIAWTACSISKNDARQCSTYKSHDFKMIFITCRTVFHCLELLIPTDRINHLYRYECTSYQETQAPTGWPKHLIWYVLSVSHSRNHMMVLGANLNLHCAIKWACTCWLWSDRCMTPGNTGTTSMRHDPFDLPLVECSAYNSSCLCHTQ